MTDLLKYFLALSSPCVTRPFRSTRRFIVCWANVQNPFQAGGSHPPYPDNDDSEFSFTLICSGNSHSSVFHRLDTQCSYGALQKKNILLLHISSHRKPQMSVFFMHFFWDFLVKCLYFSSKEICEWLRHIRWRISLRISVQMLLLNFISTWTLTGPF